MRKVPVICAAMLSAGIMLLSGCGQIVYERLDESRVLASGHTENNTDNTEYTLMMENDHLQFWMNKDTTEFKTVNKADGSEWYSTRQNRISGSDGAAVFRFSYVDDKGNLASMDAMSDAVAEGQYVIEDYEGGVRVKYSVGQFSSSVLVPYALSKERFEEIHARIEDEFKQMKLEDFYALTDLAELMDESQKPQLLAQYPLLAAQPLYLIRDFLKQNSISRKSVADIFREAGYTQEEFEEDSKFFIAEETEDKAQPGFNVTLEYALSGSSLTVRVPGDGIQMHNEFPMTALSLLPGFGSPEEGKQGYFLLPDGSGSLMHFYNGLGRSQIYRAPVYGHDYALAAQEQLGNRPGASLPVFGIRTEDTGVLCEIAEGEAIADITAYPGDKIEVPYAYAAFNLRANYKSTLSTGRKEPFMITQKQRYQGDVLLRYHFLAGEDSGLAGMAKVVRESLFGNRAVKTAEVLPVMVEQAGMITRQNQWLGIPYKEKVNLTDFQQAADCAQDFLDSGVQDLSVKLTGWFGDGIDHAFLSGKLKPASELGGMSGLRTLLDGMKSKNVPLYLDADIQYTAGDGLFDGYSVSSNTISLLNRATGRMYEYDPASFLSARKRLRYINNSEAAGRALDNFKNTLDGWEVSKISLRFAGQSVSADYGDNAMDRQAAADEMSNRLSGLEKAGYSLTTVGANAYALPYVRSCMSVPLTSGGYDNTDRSVPFLMMVLGGQVDYYSSPVNLRGDIRRAILEAASAGAGLSCVLTSGNSSQTADSDFDFLYSTDFSFWKNSLPALFADYQQRLQGIAGRLITGYEMLAEEVFETRFEGGKSVVVNFGTQPYTDGDFEVGAEDFVVK